MNKTVTIQKLGIKFNEKASNIILIYRDNKKLKKHTIKLSNFNQNSNVSDYMNELKNDRKHEPYLRNTMDLQILRLLGIIRDRLKGFSLSESIERNRILETINPNEDLNLVDEETLSRKKAVMEESFILNQVKSTDPGFQYDVEKDFNYGDQLESNHWDSDEDEDDDSGF